MTTPAQDSHIEQLLPLLVRAKINQTQWVEVPPSDIADTGDLLIDYPAQFHSVLERYGLTGASVISDIDESALLNADADAPVRFRLVFFYDGLYTFQWEGKTYATGGLAVGKKYIVLPDATLLLTDWTISPLSPPRLESGNIKIVLNPPHHHPQTLAEKMFTFVAVVL